MSNLSTAPTAPIVAVNGNYQRHVLAASVSSTNCFSADTFSVTLAIGPNWSDDLALWASLETAYVEMYCRDMTNCLVTGMIDSISMDISRGVVKVSGRDLSSLLIDTSPDEDFVNQTAAEIVTAIALKHSLIPEVMPIQLISGRFYGDDFTRLSVAKFSRIRSEWDLVVQLARECLCDAYVAGRSLYFQPRDISDTVPLVITPDIVSALRVDRSLWINEEPSIDVSTWNSQDSISHRQSTSAGGVTGDYVFTVPNLTESQVAQQIQQYSAEISEMRQLISVEMPWVDALTTRTPVYLSGTAGVFDGIYRPKTLERRFSSTSGSRTHMTLSSSVT